MRKKSIVILIIVIIVYSLYNYLSSANSKNSQFFNFNSQSINIVKNMLVQWNNTEAGAPKIYNESPMLEYLFPATISFNGKVLLHNKLETKAMIFEIFLQNFELKEGNYIYTNPFYENLSFLQTIDHMKPIYNLYKNKEISFKITKQHIKLLHYVRIGTFDGVGINPKRPYGQLTYFAADMAEILNIKYSVDSKNRPNMSKSQLEYFHVLHDELLPALQVVLQYGKIKKGKYYQDSSYFPRWLIKDEYINE